jgi:hypothetical protein
MASSLLALIDDIATVLDDVALMAKVAAKKTAGVLGDDLALNAEQVAGVRAEREIPVVWAVGVGSLRNKVILVPAALALSAFAPWAVMPLLMVGGAYLCFEGFEKLAHAFMHDKEEEAHDEAMVQALADSSIDMVSLEKEKIKGAIRTDFVLSAEIIVITLGTVATAKFAQQVVVLSGIAVLMTFAVYGVVAGIVKLDDLGLYLSRKGGRLRTIAGRALLAAAPRMMRFLSVAGTAAMFTVGGGILMHGIPGAHELVHHVADGLAAMPGFGPLLASALPVLLDAAAGIFAGALVLGAIALVGKLFAAVKS